VSVPAKPIINTLTRMTGIEEMYRLQVQLANGKTILRLTRLRDLKWDSTPDIQMRPIFFTVKQVTEMWSPIQFITFCGQPNLRLVYPLILLEFNFSKLRVTSSIVQAQSLTQIPIISTCVHISLKDFIQLNGNEVS
jgi:hypothetical protein